MALRARPHGDGAWARGCGWAAVLTAVLSMSAASTGPASAQTRVGGGEDLPDAPSVQMLEAAAGGDADGQRARPSGRAGLRPCKDSDDASVSVGGNVPLQGPPPCMPENPISPIVTSVHIQPLNSKEKGVLAIREFLDPFNFVTIAGYSAIAVAWNSHSAYGAGFGGWAKLTGYGLVEDAQGEFFETYAIPSVAREDPRYHRMPEASMKRRFWHAIKHTYVSRHDDGRPMINYATLLTNVISAELSNLYVPGIPTNSAATARRIGIGIAADPAGTIVAEFLPDVAKHIHIHAQFVQELVDRAMTGSPTTLQ